MRRAALPIALLSVAATAAPATAIPHSGGPITINDSFAPPTSASPYPAALDVAGEPPVIEDLDVVLTGLSHTEGSDIDAVLTSPWGQRVMLLSDAGLGPASSVDLVLDDEAAADPPDPFASGTWRPINFIQGDNDVFNGLGALDGIGTSLSAFDGGDPNGTWQLHVSDDFEFDSGSIDQWQIVVTARQRAQLSLADSSQFARESAGPVTFTVRRTVSAPTFRPAAARLTLEPCGNGQARASTGTDYDLGGLQSTTVNFGAGEAEKPVVLTIVDDDVPEPNECLRVRVAPESGDADGGAAIDHTITNDDPRASRPKLGGPARQRVLRQGGIVVRTKATATGEVTATGAIALSGAAVAAVPRLRPARVSAASGESVRLKLRLTKKGRSDVRRALARRRSLTARVQVTVTDLAGGRARATRRIRLTR